MTACPRKKKLNCIVWEVAAITLLVFLAVWAIVDKTFNYTPSKELLISAGASFAICWCIWVVRTFRAIMSWWIQMNDNVDRVLYLLSDAKKDLDQIRSDAKPK